MSHKRHTGEATARRRGRGQGFTLIEMLIVIGIVAVVAAVLFPVLAATRERGRRTVCQSNLRQLALAVQQYVQDNGGDYPADSPPPNRAGAGRPAGWTRSIFPYVRSDQAFLCPDAPSDAPWIVTGEGTGRPPFTDYAYDQERLNSFVPPYPSKDVRSKDVRGSSEAQLATPATIWLNSDLGWVTADALGVLEYHHGRLVPRTSCGGWSVGSTLHSGAGNYSFLDGHVKWLTPEERGELECLNGPLPPH